MADGCGRANLLTSWLPESIEREGQRAQRVKKDPLKAHPPQWPTSANKTLPPTLSTASEKSIQL